MKGVAIAGQTNALIAEKMKKLLNRKVVEVIAGLLEILFFAECLKLKPKSHLWNI